MPPMKPVLWCLLALVAGVVTGCASKDSTSADGGSGTGTFGDPSASSSSSGGYASTSSSSGGSDDSSFGTVGDDGSTGTSDDAASDGSTGTEDAGDDGSIGTDDADIDAGLGPGAPVDAGSAGDSSAPQSDGGANMCSTKICIDPVFDCPLQGCFNGCTNFVCN
jgi:hypothetical protein